MASFNTCTLVGNLTRDVELRYIPSGTAVAELGLAVNERRKEGDGYKDVAHFFDVVCWGRTAEIANEYLTKGSQVLINGRLQQDRWEKDGKNFSKVKVVCERLVMLGSKGGNGGGGGAPPSDQGGAAAPNETPGADTGSSAGASSGASDIPFGLLWWAGLVLAGGSLLC